MDPGQLVVLRAGLPPVRGRKVVYWRERAFRARLLAPPVVPAHPRIAAAPPPVQVRPVGDLDFDLLAPALGGAGLDPLPAEGATEAEVEDWVERFIDASVRLKSELDHA